MKTVYDMGSRQILEYGLTKEATQPVAPDAYMPGLQLQLVTPESCTEREIPPELVLADLTAFLDKMS
ncbi:MAG: hypothetical protein KZQ92_05325 [Candidatus Thiodiazotropha sp. (ex Lucinoma borealis)]|nr:hypothetical protein [Candidatus Thiodiazotropha sp. (ex Lucinoma borealis)]MCU7839343.1 hypothetical protein [Candidatus Thiodiazotropha sp. (ex Troendleina suluensis)]MCU7863381.1 hypothetical protein [Candidatus Thiodiazotropha sp. (ex Lucinoma borealis)]MCU7868805.1 hypothetical protein [Candidatus Thiodiazotropha sp. (ex Lucinoma borealis)]